MLEYDEIVSLLDDESGRVIPGPGKFEGCYDLRIAEALNEGTLEGWCDEQTGSIDENGYWVGLVGRFIVSEDSQGFFDYEAHDSEITARQVFRRIEVQ